MSSLMIYGLNTTNIATKTLNHSIKCLPLTKIKNLHFFARRDADSSSIAVRCAFTAFRRATSRHFLYPVIRPV